MQSFDFLYIYMVFLLVQWYSTIAVTYVLKTLQHVSMSAAEGQHLAKMTINVLKSISKAIKVSEACLHHQAT